MGCLLCAHGRAGDISALAATGRAAGLSGTGAVPEHHQQAAVPGAYTSIATFPPSQAAWAAAWAASPPWEAWAAAWAVSSRGHLQWPWPWNRGAAVLQCSGRLLCDCSSRAGSGLAVPVGQPAVAVPLLHALRSWRGHVGPAQLLAASPTLLNLPHPMQAAWAAWAAAWVTWRPRTALNPRYRPTVLSPLSRRGGLRRACRYADVA